MADFTWVQGSEKVVVDWYSASEQFDGALEFIVFPDARWDWGGSDFCGWICESQRVYRMVL
jgi:hypothetical protein